MSSYDTMTLDEIDAAMAELRARRKVLKSSGASAQRKIIILAHRRERLMQQVNALDEQMAQLHRDQQETTHPASVQHRTRRSQTQVNDALDAILECVRSHTVAKRATIMAECQLSPAIASAYLRQLCADGKLIRRGEKSAATYLVR